MSTKKPTRPATKQQLVQRQLIDNPAHAHAVMTAAVGDVEGRVGQLEKLTQVSRTVTGSKGGNAALASLIAALASAGLIKDKTT